MNAWRVLVRGRYSLVDVLEADGRRFLVARRNEPCAPDAPQLSRRERQVLAFAAMGHSSRHIAYELGLAVPTVCMHMSRAMHKLGAQTRAEAVQRYLGLSEGRK